MTAPAPLPDRSSQVAALDRSGPSRKAIVGWTVGMLATLGTVWLVATAVVKIGEFRQVEKALEVCTPDRCAEVSDETKLKQVEFLGGPGPAARKLSFYLRLPKRWAYSKGIAVDMLGYCGEPALPELNRLLAHEDGMMRRMTAESLGKVGGPRAMDALVVALKDDDWFVRYGAVNGLGIVGEPQAGRLLEKARKDEDEHVRKRAGEVLKLIRTAQRDERR
jgi:HEAT repeat protein